MQMPSSDTRWILGAIGTAVIVIIGAQVGAARRAVQREVVKGKGAATHGWGCYPPPVAKVDRP